MKCGLHCGGCKSDAGEGGVTVWYPPCCEYVAFVRCDTLTRSHAHTHTHLHSLLYSHTLTRTRALTHAHSHSHALTLPAHLLNNNPTGSERRLETRDLVGRSRGERVSGALIFSVMPVCVPVTRKGWLNRLEEVRGRWMQGIYWGKGRCCVVGVSLAKLSVYCCAIFLMSSHAARAP